MPIKLISTSALAQDTTEPATDEDKALLIRANTQSPGIRGMLTIPTDPTFKTVILIINLFSYACVMIDFTVVLRNPDYTKNMLPMREGTLSLSLLLVLIIDVIFCNDFICVLEMLLSLCRKKANYLRSRNIAIIVLEFLSFIPYELVYIVLNGQNVRICHGLRLRYIFRLARYFTELWKEEKLKLSSGYVITLYTVLLSCVCMMAVCFRLYFECESTKNQPEIFNIKCDNLTKFDFFFTYVILNSQISYSGIFFHNAPYSYIQLMDSVLQIVVHFTSFIFIARMISIFIEINNQKYNFCLIGSRVLQGMAINDKTIEENLEIANAQQKKLKQFVKKYMVSYWKNYQIEHQKATYVGNYKVATLPSVIYSEITLDISWDMFKHSFLFRNEHVAFLRELSKVTQFTFGAKNNIICKQGKSRSFMIYVIKGVISLMDETTGSHPLISLTSGTVFGELGLFMNVPSATTIFCTTYSEYMILSRANLFKVRETYPEIYNRLRKQCLKRVDIAKNYDFIGKEMYQNGEVTFPKSKLSIRYIKHILRTYTLRPSALKSSLKTKNMFLSQSMKPGATISTTIFNAKFIPLYVEASEVESNVKTHFVSKGWNFKLKSTSKLLSLWMWAISSIAFLDCLFYPFGVAQDMELYTIFYDYFVLITLGFYILDFLSFNFIAINESDKLILDFGSILTTKIHTLGFWLDLVACVPIQIFMTLMQQPLKPYYYRLMGINRVIKIFKVNGTINSKLFFSPVILVLMQVVKSCYMVLVMLFVGYSIFHRFQYFELCNVDTEGNFFMKLCVVYQFYFSMGKIGMKITRDINLLPMIGLQILGIFVLMIVFCSNAATLALVYMPTVNYETLIDNLKRSFVLFNFPFAPRKRMTKYMSMHYSARELLHGHLMDKSIYGNMMGKSLYKIHNVKRYSAFLESLGICQNMSKAMVNNMCEIGHVVMIPQGEIILLAGSLVRFIYFIIQGECQYFTRDGIIECKHLKRGDAIGILEAFHGLKALNNVMAETDCQLLSISIDELNQELVKSPLEFKFFSKALQNDFINIELRKLHSLEPNVYPSFDDDESCRYFSHNMVIFREGFGTFRFLMILFMRHSITPYGRFWLCWEICHILVSYFYAILGIIPITIHLDIRDIWFWCFRMMDLFCLADMYFRHHLIYFNSFGIEVQHPWECAKHYWQTSFTVDLLSTIPIEFIVLPYTQTISVANLSLLRLNRFLRLSRFLGLRKFLHHRHLKIYKVDVILLYICTSLLIYNYAIVFLLYSDEYVQIVEGRPIFIKDKTFWNSYGSKVYVAIQQFCNVGIFDGFASFDQLWIEVGMNALGQIIISTLSCILIAMGLFRYMHLMTFQIKMQRLVMFMNIRKVDKNLRNELIKHFEHLWAQYEGEYLRETLKIFNQEFSEEVIHSYYAPFLQSTILFINFPKVILKELLSAPTISRHVVLISGIILKVNDVQDKIFILHKGTVQVLGPDYSYLRDLRAGSLFGCLDKVHKNRSTLTYIAKTHCEFLCIPSKYFHNIMKKYARHYNFYLKLLHSSNYDYIPSSPMQGSSATKKEKKRFSMIMARKLNRVQQILVKIFPVLASNRYIDIFFAVSITISWYFECMLIVFLHEYFHIVVYIAYLMDLVFWIKIYIDFSTTYEDENGYEIDLRSWIALRYLHKYTGFVFHFLVNVPIELFYGFVTGTYSNYQLWSYMRGNRLLKILLVFNYLRSLRKKLHINVQLIRIFYIFMVILTVQQLSVIALSHYIDILGYPYLSTFVFYTYFISKKIYTPFGLDVPEPTKNLWFKLTYVGVLLVTQLVCLYALGDCVATFAMTNFSRFRYETFIANQERVMQLVGVSPPILHRVKKYCQKMVRHGVNVQFPSFVIDAPFYLREGLLDAMFGFYLRKHPVFKQCHADFVRQVAATFKTAYFFEGDFIAFQGDIDGKMYFIHWGEIEGLVEDNLYFDIADSKYLAGDYIGFHQITHANVGHSRTYKVVSKSLFVLYLKRENVISLLEFFPASRYVFYNSNASNDGLEDAEVQYRDYMLYTKSLHE